MIPVLLSLYIKTNLSEKEYLDAVSTLKCGFLKHNFWFMNIADLTLYSVTEGGTTTGALGPKLKGVI